MEKQRSDTSISVSREDAEWLRALKKEFQASSSSELFQVLRRILDEYVDGAARRLCTEYSSAKAALPAWLSIFKRERIPLRLLYMLRPEGGVMVVDSEECERILG
ncbi:hypothetical protein [Desulfurococcus mucosus]|uniref:Uncharacterized protein n=1 Tax=Desulfurococcus mucosus (strain ATCC 35584 / DSM 2162 / JCM 9187 / O7/1) TaxID=765177 RepID=E8R885_DESM0|nr:hypothetical protein [Desulfurococcus mucosus]ADV64711.1 hypothetical protein Desmu_0392 [Desulfurococcus mucosus DSM 2162]